MWRVILSTIKVDFRPISLPLSGHFMVNVFPVPFPTIPVLFATSSRVLPAGASGWHLCTQITSHAVTDKCSSPRPFHGNCLNNRKSLYNRRQRNPSWQCQSTASCRTPRSQYRTLPRILICSIQFHAGVKPENQAC